MYKPMKIVSGDFYYLKKIEDKIVFALGDCTGHGVSGAFISSLAYATLNEILTAIDDYQPEMVLENLRAKIKSVFSNSTLSDGLDIALFILNTKTNELKFSGANQIAAIVTDNKFNIIKGDAKILLAGIPKKNLLHAKASPSAKEIKYTCSPTDLSTNSEEKTIINFSERTSSNYWKKFTNSTSRNKNLFWNKHSNNGKVITRKPTTLLLSD